MGSVAVFAPWANPSSCSPAGGSTAQAWGRSTVFVPWAKPPSCSPAGGSTAQAWGRSTVFVANLSYGTNEEDLRRLFLDCGKVVAVKICEWGCTGVGCVGGNECTYRQTDRQTEINI